MEGKTLKKVRFIYNPYSGENAILKELDKIITMHQDKGYTIVPYRIQRGVIIWEKVVYQIYLLL